jgi:hypothetical protein
MSEQQPADAAPLHVVDDGDRDFRGIAALMESNEACHANDHVGAAAAPRCQSGVVGAISVQQPLGHPCFAAGVTPPTVLMTVST